MTEKHNLPMALIRAQTDFWTRTGELLQENQSRWLELARHSLAHDMHDTQAETLDATQAFDWGALTSLPMHTGWQALNRSVGKAQDLTLTALNGQSELGEGMRRALAQWQLDTAQALSDSRNAMPFSSVLTDLMQATAPGPTKPAEKKHKQQHRTHRTTAAQPAPARNSAAAHQANSNSSTSGSERHAQA